MNHQTLTTLKSSRVVWLVGGFFIATVAALLVWVLVSSDDSAVRTASEATPSSQVNDSSSNLDTELDDSSAATLQESATTLLPSASLQPDTETSANQSASAASTEDLSHLSVIAMASLGNRPVRTKAAYWFVANQTGDITSLRQYYVVNNQRPGYALGTGGKMLVSVAPDNGKGLPDESKIFPGTITVDFKLNNGAPPAIADYVQNVQLGKFEFSSAIPVEKGKKYFIIFENTDSRPTANYVSLDLAIDLRAATNAPNVPPISPNPGRRYDLGYLEDRGGSWVPYDTRPEGHWYTPIFEVTYSDGTVIGNGFMEWEHEATFTLAGSSALRTTIKLPKSKTITELAARSTHHPTAPLILELTTIDGTVLRSVTVKTTGDANHRNAVWVIGEIEPLTLEAGKEYALVFRAGPGYSGTVVPLKSSFGFTQGTQFPYGKAQTSSDGKNWTTWGNGILYFSMAIK